MKKKIVFFCNDVTLAHPVRTVLLANALDPEKYDVVVYHGGAYRDLMPACKFPTHSIYSMKPAEFFKRLDLLQPIFDEELVACYLADEEAVFDRERPDVVIGDFRLTLQISARKRNIPYINIANAIWSPSVDIPYDSPRCTKTKWVHRPTLNWFLNKFPQKFFASSMRALNQARVQAGMRAIPPGDLKTLYADADHVLYCDMPSLFQSANFTAHEHFLGPITWGLNQAMPDLGEILTNGHYTVYINLGSSGDKQALAYMCQELARQDINLIIATGGSDHLQTLKNRPRVYMAPFLPSDKMARVADITICNGGVPTVMTALLNGSYVVGLCTNMDQEMNMGMFEQAGLGARFDNTSSSLQRLAEFIQTRPRLSLDRKQAIQQECAAYKPEEKFAEFMQEHFAVEEVAQVPTQERVHVVHK